MDGKILKENLSYINKDEKWLNTRLKKEYGKDLSNLLLVTVDAKEQLKIYEKNEKNQEKKKILE